MASFKRNYGKELGDVLWCDDMPVFEATPADLNAKKITVSVTVSGRGMFSDALHVNSGVVTFDIKSMVREEMEMKNLDSAEVTITLDDGTDQSNANGDTLTLFVIDAKTIMEMDAAEFCRSNFLSSVSAKTLPLYGEDMLSYFVSAGSSPAVKVRGIYKTGSGNLANFEYQMSPSTVDYARVVTVPITWPGQFTSGNLTPVMMSVRAGRRVMEYFFTDAVTSGISFRNNFNIEERWFGPVSPTVDNNIKASTAVISGIRRTYEIKNEQSVTLSMLPGTITDLEQIAHMAGSPVIRIIPEVSKGVGFDSKLCVDMAIADNEIKYDYDADDRMAVSVKCKPTASTALPMDFMTRFNIKELSRIFNDAFSSEFS